MSHSHGRRCMVSERAFFFFMRPDSAASEWRRRASSVKGPSSQQPIIFPPSRVRPPVPPSKQSARSAVQPRCRPLSRHCCSTVGLWYLWCPNAVPWPVTQRDLVRPLVAWMPWRGWSAHASSSNPRLTDSEPHRLLTIMHDNAELRQPVKEWILVTPLAPQIRAPG
jgi:hypothetical protein